jgi:hypothetical protein
MTEAISQPPEGRMVPSRIWFIDLYLPETIDVAAVRKAGLSYAAFALRIGVSAPLV